MQKPIHRAGYRRFKIGAKTNFGRDYEYKSKNDSEKTESLAGMEDWQLGSSLSLRYTAWQSLSVDMKECAFGRTKAEVSRLPGGIFNKAIEGIGTNPDFEKLN